MIAKMTILFFQFGICDAAATAAADDDDENDD